MKSVKSEMKRPLLLLPLVVGILGYPMGMKSAIAQCVQADIGVQYNISGSRVPTRRSNDVQQRGSGDCVGNTNVTTGVQGNVGGTAPVTQRRRVRQTYQGERNRNVQGRQGKRDIIQIQVNPQIDVYNPADRFRGIYKLR